MADALLVIRPSTSQYKKMLKTTPVFFLILAGFLALRQGILGLALAVVAVGGTVGLVFLYMYRAHLIVTRNELVRVGMVGRRSWPRSGIATAVDARMPASAMDSRVFLNLFLLDPSGRKILRLKNTHWHDADLNRLTEVLGLPVDSTGEIVTAQQFDMQYPDVLPFIERRPWLTALLIAGGVAVLVVVLGVIIG